MKRLTLLLATGFGIGYIPKLPGTSATLLGCALAWLLRDLGVAAQAAILTAALPLGVWIAGRAEKIFGHKDPRSVVIDEILGLPVSLLGIPVGWMTLLGAFVFFRFFDIIKPFPVNKLQSLPGGWGIMIDDYAAGLYACGTLHLILYWVGALQS